MLRPMAYFPALRLLRREEPKWRNVEVRTCKYLNNIVERDHRAIKRRCASLTGFKSFTNAAITIARFELRHRIHKRQLSFGPGLLPHANCNQLIYRNLRTLGSIFSYSPE